MGTTDAGGSRGPCLIAACARLPPAAWSARSRASLPGAGEPRGRAAGGRWAEAHGRLPGGSGFSAAPRPELLSQLQAAPPTGR